MVTAWPALSYFVWNIKVLAVEMECMEILPKQGEKITGPDITIFGTL